MTVNTKRFLAVAAVVILMIAGPGLAQEQERETFRALARHVGTGPTGQTSIQITIDRFSTGAEHDHMLGVVMSTSNAPISSKSVLTASSLVMSR